MNEKINYLYKELGEKETNFIFVLFILIYKNNKITKATGNIINDIYNYLNEENKKEEAKKYIKNIFEIFQELKTKAETNEFLNFEINEVYKDLENIIEKNKFDKLKLFEIYEFLTYNFQKQDKARFGEFYTPKELSYLLNFIMFKNTKQNKDNLKIFEPTAGLGSLLIDILDDNEIKDKELYFEEFDKYSFSLFYFYIYLKDKCKNFKYVEGRRKDVLREPSIDLFETFDVILANPPFSLKWKGTTDENKHLDERFKDEPAITKESGDFAFIYHILKHLNDKGRAAALVPADVLAKKNNSYFHNKNLVYKNVIEQVYFLPKRTFENASNIATAIIVLNKNKTDENIEIFDFRKLIKISDENKHILDIEKIKQLLENIKENKPVKEYKKITNQEVKTKDNCSITANYIFFETYKPKAIEKSLLIEELKEVSLKINENINLIIKGVLC